MKTDITVSYVDEILRQYLPKTRDKVLQAMEYSLFSGGKRFRPMLLLSTAKAVGGRINDGAKTLAAALEFVHTYSLIHDDLPCMDNDDFRRGKRSCHMQFGEASAVLAGDALLNLAFETALTGPMSNKRYQAACAYLFKMSGILGLVHGQSLDLFTETRTVEDATELAINKTGTLIRAALVCGALCGGATDEEAQIFDDIACKLGVCYQVIDDILDSAKCEKSFLDIYTEQDLIDHVKVLNGEVNALCDKLPYDLTFIKQFCEQNLARKK
ncbi:MAG: polyprenyl synthetase family protein [Clostridiales bacterium]|nr:polyprenyl synthetase family protein [Clostridiales bacterium]